MTQSTSVAQRLLGTLAGDLLTCQFGSNRLESLFDGSPVSTGTADRLIAGKTLVAERRLKLTNRSLRLFERSFSMFLCRCERAHSLPSSIELVR